MITPTYMISKMLISIDIGGFTNIENVSRYILFEGIYVSLVIDTFARLRLESPQVSRYNSKCISALGISVVNSSIAVGATSSELI